MNERNSSVTQRSGDGLRERESAYYADDEISLFDLWAVLVRRRYWLFGVAVLVVVIAAAYALTRTPAYRFTTVIEVGARINGGEVTPVESPSNARTKLNAHYIPAAIADWTREHADAGWQPSVNADVPQNANVITLESTGPETRAGAYREVMLDATTRLQQDHARVTQRIRSQIQLEIEAAENRVEATRDRIESLEGDISRLDRRQELIDDEIGDLEDLLATAEARRTEAASNVPDPADAMTLLMVSNEIRETHRRLSELREARLVGIPESRDALLRDIEDARRMITEQEGQVRVLREDLENISYTRPLSEAQQSLRPEGPGARLIVALGAVLGMMLGLFAAFGREFVVRANEHMHPAGS